MEAVATDSKRNQATLTFKNPLSLPCGFVVESGSSAIDQQRDKRAAALAKVKTSPIGTWQWHNTDDVTFTVNRTVSTKDGNTYGTWTMTGPDVVKIHWHSEWYDTLTLASDGMSMVGYSTREKNGKDGNRCWGKRRELK